MATNNLLRTSLVRSRRALCFHGTRARFQADWSKILEEVGFSAREWRDFSGGTAVARSSTVNTFQIRLSNGEGLFFKRYVYSVPSLRFAFPMPSKAVVECFGYGHLNRIGIPVPEVVAVGERRIWGRLSAAFIVTRQVPGTVDLEKFARKSWTCLSQQERRFVRESVCTNLVLQLRRAHGRRFFHRDLKWRNILIQRQGKDYLPVWIDCPRACFVRLLRSRAQIVELSNLARLARRYLSRTQQLRFLHQYLGPKAVSGETRTLLCKIQRHLNRHP